MRAYFTFLFIFLSFNPLVGADLRYRDGIKELSTALISWKLNSVNNQYCEKHWLLKRIYEGSTYFASCRCIVKSLIKLGRAIPFSEEVLQDVTFSKRDCQQFSKKERYLSIETIKDIENIKKYWNNRDLSPYQGIRIQLVWSSIERKVDFSNKMWRKIKTKLPNLQPVEAKILSELFKFRSVRENFEEILKGAHVRILNQTQLYDIFKKLPESSKRKSSHPSDGDQFSIQGGLIPEFLFGKLNISEKGNFFWFQFENSPWGKGAKQDLIHLKDTIKYFAQLKKFNIGPFGKSKFTDKNPLIIIDNPL